MNHGFNNPQEGEGITLSATLLHPESCGQITLASDDPFDDPLINPNHLDEEVDMERLIEDIKRTRETSYSSALDEYRGEEVQPEGGIESDEDLREHIRKTAKTIYHPVGTCKMGDNEMAVVDDRLYGLNSFRIVDVSIMPCITTENTNAPIIAIAEKEANLLKEFQQ